MTWLVYILECADATFYTGITTDLKKRMAKHASSTGAKYTRGRGPFLVRLQETYPTKSEALAREAAIKRLSRQQKMILCEGS